VCCINWADSGPGYSWPESYYVTYIEVEAERWAEEVWGADEIESTESEDEHPEGEPATA